MQIEQNLPGGYEPSGLIWHPYFYALFLLSDDGIITKMNLDGEEVTNWVIRGDLEGITIKDPNSEYVYVVKEFPFEALEGDIDDLVANAMVYRPDLLYEKESFKFNRLKIRLNKSKELPNLSFKGTYKREGEGWPGDKSAWALILNFSYSLYNSTISSSASQNKRGSSTSSTILIDCCGMTSPISSGSTLGGSTGITMNKALTTLAETIAVTITTVFINVSKALKSNSKTLPSLS